MTDRLTARERRNLAKMTGRLTKSALCAWAAVPLLIGAGIWLGDWRYAGLGGLTLVLALVLTGLNGWLGNPRTVESIAKRLRGKERAQAADIEDLERDLGLRREADGR